MSRKCDHFEVSTITSVEPEIWIREVGYEMAFICKYPISFKVELHIFMLFYDFVIVFPNFPTSYAGITLQ